MTRPTRTLAFAAVAVSSLAAAGFAILYSGVYNIAATSAHSAPVYWVLETGMRESVRRRAQDLVVPPLDDIALVQRGRVLHDQQCVRCHGAPGIAPDSFALGLNPPAANLAHTAREWSPAELFWAIKYGIKMTGMPAWEFRLADADLWAIVAYLVQLPAQSPADYRASASASTSAAIEAQRNAGDRADAVRGKVAIHQYGCATCHDIPGITGARAPVGPPLARIAMRDVIAGTLPNTTDNMVRWLRAPQSVHRDSAMPNLGLSERDARDIAAYLATL